MFRGLVLSALVAAPFAPLASASSPCESCVNGRYCSYVTSGASSTAGYGVCYKDKGGACPDAYGDLTATYGSIALTKKQIDVGGSGTECDAPAKALTATSALSFDTFAEDTLKEEKSCAACVGDGTKNKWCQYKTSGGDKLAGGYCTASGSTCMTLKAFTTDPTAEPITDKMKCSDAPTNKCTECLAGTSKVFCAYSSNEAPPVPLYYSCMNSSVTTCPTIAGLDAMYAALKDKTKVTGTRVTAPNDCTPYESLTTQDLNLGDTPANTDQTKCDECVKKNGAKWCNYVSKTGDNKDGPSGGYCGANTSCAALDKFNQLTITNSPKGPKTTCDSGSAAFPLSSPSSLLIAATTCAAATWAYVA